MIAPTASQNRHVTECCQLVALSLVLVCANALSQDRTKPDSTPPAQDSTNIHPKASPPATTMIRLPEGTPVKLKLLHSLNSRTVVESDPLNFSLAEDLIVNGKVLARAGSAAIGQVRQAASARALGRGAQMELGMQYFKAGRVKVPLRGAQARVGSNKKGETVALLALFGLSGLLKHGSEVEVKGGSVFTAYVDQDTELMPLADATTEVQ